MSEWGGVQTGRVEGAQYHGRRVLVARIPLLAMSLAKPF